VGALGSSARVRTALRNDVLGTLEEPAAALGHRLCRRPGHDAATILGPGCRRAGQDWPRNLPAPYAKTGAVIGLVVFSDDARSHGDARAHDPSSGQTC